MAAEKKENQPLRDRVAQLEAELKESREKQLELNKELGANEEKLRLTTAKNREYKEVAKRENEIARKYSKEKNEAVKKLNDKFRLQKQLEAMVGQLTAEVHEIKREQRAVKCSPEGSRDEQKQDISLKEKQPCASQ
jgi:predicted RNase H-like nuclease (RuvC/YqgF family)